MQILLRERRRSRSSLRAALALAIGFAIAPTLQVQALTTDDLPSNRRSGLSITYPYAPISPSDIIQRLQQEATFYEQRIQQRPGDGLELAALAQIYLKLAQTTGQPDWFLKSEQAAQASLKQLPFNNESAMLTLAQISEAKHDFTASIQRAQQVLEQKPNHAPALSLLVTSYLAQGKLDQAAAQAQLLAKQVPTLSSYILQALTYAEQHRDAAAIEQFELALLTEQAGEPGTSARLRNLFGRFHSERGDLLTAKRLHGEALKIMPGSVRSLVALAQIETSLGNYRQAEQLYRQIPPTDPQSPDLDHEALEGLAELALLQGDRPTAQKYWQQAEAALRAEITSFAAFSHRRDLAQILLAQGQPEKVVEALALMEAERAIRQDDETLETLAWALNQSGQLQQAEAIAQQGLAQYPRNAALLYRAGLIAQDLGKLDQAQMLQQQAKLINPYVAPAATLSSAR
jgi:tetratricopeptide (TPR) repeat protein